MTDAALIAPHFQDPDKAREFLEAKRWPDGPVCPHCGIIGEAFKLTPKAGLAATDEREEKRFYSHGRKGLWKCSACREQFSVTVGTIFEDSHIPLNKWLVAFHLLCASKKGMSAHQLHRMLGITYKSAWFMAHRIRYSMTQDPFASLLNGIVETDECYIGGKSKGKRGRPDTESNKTAVVSMVERNLVNGHKGKVRSFPMERVTAENLNAVLKDNVDPAANLQTDEARFYINPGRQFASHDVVKHFDKEYVRYEPNKVVTTNSVEGYFGLLKRGITGVYHHVGKGHLHRYLSEFDFRYNSREITDTERRDLAIKGVTGKRLTYKAPIKANKERREMGLKPKPITYEETVRRMFGPVRPKGA